MNEMIPCPLCGYDLQASREAGRCPECGWQYPPGAMVMAAKILDLRPSIPQAITAAVLWIVAVAVLNRFRGLAGTEWWIAWGLLVLTSILLIRTIYAWRRQRLYPQLHPGRVALVASGDSISLWNAGGLLHNVHVKSIESLKVRQFRGALSIEIREVTGRRIILRACHNLRATNELRSRLLAMLSDLPC